MAKLLKCWNLISVTSAFLMLPVFLEITEIYGATGTILAKAGYPNTTTTPVSATTPDSTTSSDAPVDTIADGRSRYVPVFAVNNLFSPFRITGTDTYEFRSTYGIHHIPQVSPQYKNRSRARLYSAALTVVPIIVSRGMSTGYTLSDQSGASLLLITSGIVAGPSGGSIYAEDWRLASRSILIRGASTATMVTGYVISKNVDDDAAGLLMMISGALVLTGHALYDIFILSAHSVDYYNMRTRMEAGLSIHQTIPDSWTKWAAGTHPRSQPHSQPQPQPQLHLILPRFTLRFHF